MSHLTFFFLQLSHVLLFILISFSCISPIRTQTTPLHIERIETNDGFSVIQTETTHIPTTFNYSLHIIELTELTNILHEIQISWKEINSSHLTTLLKYDIDQIENKLLTLNINTIPRKKRGIINAIGTVNKWIGGTMDDEDRQLINEHLRTIEINNHNIITNVNQQIHINTNFNNSINTLKNAILQDRLNFKEMVDQKINESNVIYRLHYKVQEFEKILSQLQETIQLSRLHIFHPSLLTADEIKMFKVDSEKLKHIHLGYSRTSQSKLLFIVKIPFTLTYIKHKLIVPLSNLHNCIKIVSPITSTFEYKNTLYEYDETKSIPQLNRLNHCIIHNKCPLTEDCYFDTIHIDDDIVIIQNSNDLILESTCDDRKFTLFGNYFIRFNNCTIFINNESFSNTNTETTHKFIMPINLYTNNTDSPTFKDIVIKNIANTKHIHELTTVTQITSYTAIISIIIIIIGVTTYTYIKCKKPQITIINEIPIQTIDQENLVNPVTHIDIEDVNPKTVKPQESLQSKGREVTSDLTHSQRVIF